MQCPLLKIQQNHEQTEIGKGKECAYGCYLRDGEPDTPNTAFFHLRFTTETNSVHWRAFSESPTSRANVEAADTWKKDSSSRPSTRSFESLGTTALLLLAHYKAGECLKDINPVFKLRLRCRDFPPLMMCMPQAQLAKTCWLWGSVFYTKYTSEIWSAAHGCFVTCGRGCGTHALGEPAGVTLCVA